MSALTSVVRLAPCFQRSCATAAGEEGQMNPDTDTSSLSTRLRKLPTRLSARQRRPRHRQHRLDFHERLPIRAGERGSGPRPRERRSEREDSGCWHGLELGAEVVLGSVWDYEAVVVEVLVGEESNRRWGLALTPELSLWWW